MAHDTAPGAQRTVEHIMTTHVVTVSPDVTAEEAQHLLHTRGFHHLVVVEAGRVVGVISDRDVLRTISPFVGKAVERQQDSWTAQKRVHQFMTRALIWTSPATPIREAAHRMLDGHVSCLPVLDDSGACVGIVTWRDFLVWSLVQMGEDDARCELPPGSAGRAA